MRGYGIYKDVVSFAARNNIIVCHDAAYSEVYYDNKKPLSFLQVPGAKDMGIEFHSLSKTYNMTGWRIGFAVGTKMPLRASARSRQISIQGSFRPFRRRASRRLIRTIPC